MAKYSGLAPETLIAYYGAMIARPDRTTVLRQSACPVLFIIGQDDNVIPIRQVLEQSYLPSISHLHLIPNTGHQAMLENPETSNRLLRDFLNFISRI
jgi:pimeloyl-ACP methyl ester carboxylesterase